MVYACMENNHSPAFQDAAVWHAESTSLPTRWGVFGLHGFVAGSSEHLVLTFGDIKGEEPVLIRLHSECLTGDALFSQRCDCGAQLETAMMSIAKEGRGMLVYLRQEGRGIGLMNKLRAYALQDTGLDTWDANERLGFPADARDYTICKPLIEHFGVRQLRVMTNNPDKILALVRLGFDVIERVPLLAGACAYNARYLTTKEERFGHLLDRTTH